LHKLKTWTKNNILRVTITDCKQEFGEILFSYEPVIFLRSHNLPSQREFINSLDIMSNFSYDYFHEDEKKFIQACAEFNSTISLRKERKQVLKIVMDENISFYSENSSTGEIVNFVFNEKYFDGLLRKYISPEEVRKMIRSLFE